MHSFVMLVARGGLGGVASRFGVGRVHRGGGHSVGVCAGRSGAMAPDPRLVGDTFFLDDFAIRQVSCDSGCQEL